MATFEEGIIYPLILLLIGAAVSGTTTTWATIRSENRKHQLDIEMDNRKRELEIKEDITSKMTEAIAQLDAEATFLISRKNTLEKEEKNAFFHNAKKWYVDWRSMHSKLEIYFPNTGIVKRWDEYYYLLEDFVNASRMYFDQDSPVEDLRPALSDVKDGLERYLSNEKLQDLSKEGRKLWKTLSPAYDEALWLDIQGIIRREGDKLIEDVLRASPQ